MTQTPIPKEINTNRKQSFNQKKTLTQNTDNQHRQKNL